MPLARALDTFTRAAKEFTLRRQPLMPLADVDKPRLEQSI